MRKIEGKMVDFFDSRLLSNGLAVHAIETKNARLLMTEAAKVCVGIREKTNRNDGPMVELIQETIGKAEGESWCMSFVQTCIAYAELKTGVKSPLPATEGCTDLWERAPKVQRVRFHPLSGAIVIWRYGSSWKGHTGIVLSCDEGEFEAVEGNTSSGSDDPNGPIVREGGGVYFTRRSRTGSARSDMRVVGFLKPF